MNKPLHARAPLKVASGVQRVRIACPHEPIGFVDVDVPVLPPASGGGIQIDLKQTFQCSTCRKYFRLGTQIVLTGVPLDVPIGNAPLHPDAFNGASG